MDLNSRADAQWRLETGEITKEDSMNYYFYNTITEKWEIVPDNKTDVRAELQDREDVTAWMLERQASDIKIREDGDK